MHKTENTAWLAALGHYNENAKSIVLAAVITDGNGRAMATAMSTVNASEQKSVLDRGLMALELGAELALANGLDAVAVWPGLSEAAGSVCRAVGPSGTCPSGDYFRKGVRFEAAEPDRDEKAYLDYLAASLRETLSEAEPMPMSGSDPGTEALAHQVLELYNGTPDGRIRDADTVLKDFTDEADMEVTGLGPEIIGTWLGSHDRPAFEKLFHGLTGRTFGEYLRECADLTSR